MEEVLLSVMYEVPSNPDVARVLITREVVLENVNPTIVPRSVAAAPAQPGTTARRSRPEPRPQTALDMPNSDECAGRSAGGGFGPGLGFGRLLRRHGHPAGQTRSA